MQALHVTSDMIGYIHTKRMYDKGGAMARNKYPQRTVEKILEVSLALFNEKGYEKTTIQDIVNALGMSKGAIYHHFKSKDEIIEALSERCYHGDAQMELLRNASDKTGIEKLRAIIYWICSPIVLKELDAIPGKVAYFRTLCDSMGIPVIDEPLEQELTSYFRILAQSMHELP